jgi:hypothetical protein
MLRRAKKDPYLERLKDEFEALIESLRLDSEQKRFVRSRWLDQVIWMSGRANQARDRYYRLRFTTVTLAVIIPGLVSLTAIDGGWGDWGTAIKLLTLAVSTTVAVCAAIEEFFHFGERWRTYRRTVERLKTEGWLYFELSGPYHAEGATHRAAFTSFVQRVEEIIQRDVEVYVTEVTVEKERQEQGSS